MGSNLAILLAVATGLGTPFEDVRGRFVIDLPANWTFAPQPGQVTGASFQRVFNGVPASFAVQVMEIGPRTTLDAFVEAIASGVANEAGYEILEEEHGRLAGLSTLRRRYKVAVKGWAKNAKMAEDYFAVQGGRGYLVHYESSIDVFAALGPDFEHLLNSLRFSGIDPLAPSPHPKKLTGRWLMVGTTGTIFELKADGTFDLDGTPGVWRVSGPKLFTRPLGGGAEAFDWKLEKDELVLSGANLDVPIRYRRSGWTQPNLVALPTAGLVGTWSAKGHRLEVKPGNQVVLNGKSGTYVEADGMLVMRLGADPERLVVEYTLKEDALTLAREQFGRGVTFRRQ